LAGEGHHVNRPYRTVSPSKSPLAGSLCEQ
jgi:hypothetical protein